MAKKDTQQTRFVRLDAPGVIACGTYRAGQVYEVDAAEGARLIDCKGFVEVEPPPAVPDEHSEEASMSDLPSSGDPAGGE
ncbi:hypothetical protein [Methylogaea oryzae]|uniref:Uncharacterized protein n=1 Tax=Methylogaea oryzae TaxID=1295382 RepID=A0A8D4VN82_9GAMM|nr:hypothetical protein [Methylogaea oryzae]BBL70329.1 hypothetical protein MoryE10_09350 [Methylogaea oryzae]